MAISNRIKYQFFASVPLCILSLLIVFPGVIFLISYICNNINTINYYFYYGTDFLEKNKIISCHVENILYFQFLDVLTTNVCSRMLINCNNTNYVCFTYEGKFNGKCVFINDINKFYSRDTDCYQYYGMENKTIYNFNNEFSLHENINATYNLNLNSMLLTKNLNLYILNNLSIVSDISKLNIYHLIISILTIIFGSILLITFIHLFILRLNI